MNEPSPCTPAPAPAADAKRRKRRLIVVAAVVLVAVAAASGWHKLGPYHVAVVQPGVLYRGGSQSPLNMKYLHRKYEFKTIVSLRGRKEGGWEPDWFGRETAFCKANGVRFVNIPMQGKRPPTDEQVAQWLALLADRSNHPIYVHCAQGVTRTGVMVALYQIALQNNPPPASLGRLAPLWA